MQTNVFGSLAVDGMQDMCSLEDSRETPESALTLVSTVTTPINIPAAEDQCFGWRCPGCRSCHAPSLQTCPVCDTLKHPLVPLHIERTLMDDLANALNPLENPCSLFHTVHVKALLEAVRKLRT